MVPPDVAERYRRIVSSRAFSWGSVALVAGAAVVGVVTVAGGATPQWMRTGAWSIGLAVAFAVVMGSLEATLDGRLGARVERLLRCGDHIAAAANMELLIGRDIRRIGPDHPIVLRRLTTLAHVLMLAGRDREALDLLSVLRLQQEDVLGTGHPDLTRTERVLAAAVAGRASDAEIGTGWRWRWR